MTAAGTRRWFAELSGVVGDFIEAILPEGARKFVGLVISIAAILALCIGPKAGMVDAAVVTPGCTAVVSLFSLFVAGNYGEHRAQAHVPVPSTPAAPDIESTS